MTLSEKSFLKYVDFDLEIIKISYTYTKFTEVLKSDLEGKTIMISLSLKTLYIKY